LARCGLCRGRSLDQPVHRRRRLTTAALVNPGLPEGPHEGLRRVALLMPGSCLTAWLNLGGLSSLLLGILTLIPGRSAGLRTDGGQLLDLVCSR
jgi:hypothetical protein